MSLISERINKAMRASGPTDSALNYQLLGGKFVPIADSSINYIQKGYNINDIIYSIINLILDKVRLAPWSIYQVVDESSLKKYKALTSKKDLTAEDVRTAKMLHSKAFKPVSNAGRWSELIKYPNEQESSFNDFVANGIGYKLLTGNKYIWGSMIDGGANKGTPFELWLMPSQLVQVLASTNSFPIKAVGYEMFVLGLTGKRGYTIEEVMHEKFFNYDYSANGSHLIGMAPLRSALRLTNRNNSALDASTAKFQNGGVESIIYLDEQAPDRQEAMQSMAMLKQKLINEYTGPNNAGKIAASGYKVGVANLGLSPVELAIIDAEKWDLRRFCNVFSGVPSQLLNDPENKTYNNQKEGEKALTSRCALTHLTAFRDSLNKKAHQHWGLNPNWIIDFDLTVYGELQENMKEMMDWITPLANLTALSPNRILELMGLEKINDPLMDENWIRPSMGQPQSEWEMNDVDKALSDE